MVDSRANNHALRRRYQRTTNNNELRESRKNQYQEEKTKYRATIRREKIKSWKAFCNLTASTNPWNAVYKIAANKAKRTQTFTTLQKPDGTLTTDINETVTYLLDYLITKYEEDNDLDYHKTIRTLTEQPIQRADNTEYMPEEIGKSVESINCKKTPG
jgi:hypothetical protein